jgi:hypothetical protein
VAQAPGSRPLRNDALAAHDRTMLDAILSRDTFSLLSHVTALSIAYVLAFPIGWNREGEERSAGLRTFPLFAVATCGFIQAAEGLTRRHPEATARVIEGLITGMGFIGGGAICVVALHPIALRHQPRGPAALHCGTHFSVDTLNGGESHRVTVAEEEHMAELVVVGFDNATDADRGFRKSISSTSRTQWLRYAARTASSD